MKLKSFVLTIALALCIIILAFSIPAMAGDNNKAPLRIVAYDFSLLWDLGIFDDEGRLLVWKGSTKGHVEGYVVWWFDMPFKEQLIHEDFTVSFYSGKWEIYDSDPFPSDGSGGVVANPDAKILLAGISAGETLYPTDPPNSDGIWDGQGIVTETSAEYRQWKGCVMYEGGPVVLSSATGAPGKIRIYPKGFRPADLLNQPAANNSEEMKTPEKFGQLKNYPNPFNPSTTIEFDLPEATQVRIDIFNSVGQKVETLLNKEMQAGNHKVEWNASEMASGTYYYRIQANGIQDGKRMILLK